MRLFLAGPSAVRERLGHIIRDDLPKIGHTAYDWTSDSAWDAPDTFCPATVARADLAELKAADAVIWHLDSNPSHGAPFEAGFALGHGIPLVIWVVDDELPRHLIYGYLGPGHAPGTAYDERLVITAHNLNDAVECAAYLVRKKAAEI